MYFTLSTAKLATFIMCIFLFNFITFAQNQEKLFEKKPIFQHTQYNSSSWGDYIAIRSEHSPIRTKQAYNSCLVEQIIVECKLNKNKTITDIRFSANTPTFIQEKLTMAIIESAQYWKPKKIKDRYVDSKIVFAWGCVLMRGCPKGTQTDSIVYSKYYNPRHIDISKNKKYKKYDYLEQFHTIILGN